ncbi:hypothetical protein [Xanthomonas sp. MUS 060]|uniref:hypothetical protein n=1 Tax=Xanthomonas sp. MUS 060 TaxID=1588031 RepID=UPI0005F283ED|nr:hypothetical protein [Xanthomonas sp. MUS 060]
MAAFEGGIADTGTPVTASLADARSKRFRVLVLKQAGHADAGRHLSGPRAVRTRTPGCQGARSHVYGRRLASR